MPVEPSLITVSVFTLDFDSVGPTMFTSAPTVLWMTSETSTSSSIDT